MNTSGHADLSEGGLANGSVASHITAGFSDSLQHSESLTHPVIEANPLVKNGHFAIVRIFLCNPGSLSADVHYDEL